MKQYKVIDPNRRLRALSKLDENLKQYNTDCLENKRALFEMCADDYEIQKFFEEDYKHKEKHNNTWNIPNQPINQNELDTCVSQIFEKLSKENRNKIIKSVSPRKDDDGYIIDMGIYFKGLSSLLFFSSLWCECKTIAENLRLLLLNERDRETEWKKIYCQNESIDFWDSDQDHSKYFIAKEFQNNQNEFIKPLNLDYINSIEAIIILLGVEISNYVIELLNTLKENTHSYTILSMILTKEESTYLNRSKYLRNYEDNNDYLFQKNIPTQEFITWAVEKGFLIEAEETTIQKTEILTPKQREQLYKLLKDKNLITGEMQDKWQWNGNRNQLSYLAKELKRKRVLGDNLSDSHTSFQFSKP